MRLLESFIRWLERRYEHKLEKFCLTYSRDFAEITHPRLRDHDRPRNHDPQGERWLLGIATERFNDIAMYRVHVAVPFKPHSVDQKEIHHER